jgi:hypothetical protein
MCWSTEIHPDADGFDFGELKDMLAWRDAQRQASAGQDPAPRTTTS